MGIQYNVSCVVCGFAHNRETEAEHAREKACVVCHRAKPLSDFPVHLSSFDGHRRTCTVCLAAPPRAAFPLTPQSSLAPLAADSAVSVGTVAPVTAPAGRWGGMRGGTRGGTPGATPSDQEALTSLVGGATVPTPLTWHERFPTQAAVRASARLLTEQQALILDTETTGLHPVRDQLASLSLVRLSWAGTAEVVIDTLLNPQMPIPARASAIHHIFDRDVADAPLFGQVWLTQLLPLLLETPVVVAYNAHFDLGFLAQAVAAARRRSSDTPPLPALQVYCAMRMALAWHEGRHRSLSLARACALSGIAHTHQHAAVGDALATHTLISRYARDA